MRHISLIVAALFGLLFVPPPHASGDTAYQNGLWWHRLTQDQKNANILNRAVQDVGKNVGQTCKEWVRSVVLDASKSVVNVPPNKTQWTWDLNGRTDVALLATDSWDGSVWLKPGQIMQAQVGHVGGGTVEHTLVIFASDRFGITIVDANFTGTGAVRKKTYNWVDFKGLVRHYSLYEIR